MTPLDLECAQPLASAPTNEHLRLRKIGRAAGVRHGVALPAAAL
ncbi:hypothetical protein Pla163_01060 [Planctomycetes bacterium Pla163]|uniref:Uncharacterized protein n=1 Tax=Rohdeia mirabilis TaxID=2528008 RepID=A0A518CUV3_9BACT|nr:hypothetical protein Pla163_01060 [Planctomycetes bacterium Pla163]